ncbi:MAG: hypothetical protein QF569_29325, partial [Candidatus Poribacteria bacterium]|nr:hypothetical protein [Candidatus Poribacteria bacterium]
MAVGFSACSMLILPMQKLTSFGSTFSLLIILKQYRNEIVDFLRVSIEGNYFCSNDKDVKNSPFLDEEK